MACALSQAGKHTYIIASCLRNIAATWFQRGAAAVVAIFSRCRRRTTASVGDDAAAAELAVVILKRAAACLRVVALGHLALSRLLAYLTSASAPATTTTSGAS